MNNANKFARRVSGVGLVALPCLLAHTGGQAQVPPGAGTLQRQTEPGISAPPGSERTPPAATQPRPAEDTRAPRVLVKRFVVAGATLIATEELQAQLTGFVGRSLTMSELEQATQRIADLYRKSGWFVRVFLPGQDVTDGTVRIQVVEGRYGTSQLQSRATRADTQDVGQTVTHGLTPGEPLSAAALERGLLLANDLPGVQVTGVLQAGRAAGTSDLAIQVDDTPLVTGDVGLSNFGMHATGRLQAAGGVALNNLGGRGDQLGIRALAARGIANGVLRYSLPVGHDGWRLAATTSTLGYKLGDPWTALDAKGRALTFGLAATYPIIRASDHNLNFSLAYAYQRFDDDALGASLRRQRGHAMILGLAGDLRDSLGGGGISWGSVQLTHGRLNLSGNPGDAAVDAAGPRAAGAYNKLVLSANRLQALGASGFNLQAGLVVQLADRNLASFERFSLGGPQGVRAYPGNEASGDEGLLFKAELQYELGSGWQALAFYDFGQIRQHHRPWPGWGGGLQPNRYTLSGVGLGLNWRRDGWRLGLSVATPLGHNAGAGLAGRNNDGSSAGSARYWFNLTRSF